MHVHGNRFKQYLPNDVVCLFTQKTKKKFQQNKETQHFLFGDMNCIFFKT